jgi:hypothetical protein
VGSLVSSAEPLTLPSLLSSSIFTSAYSPERLTERLSSLTKASGGSILPSLILRACLPAANPNVSFQQGLERERQLFISAASESQTKAVLYHSLAEKRIERLRSESPQLISAAQMIVTELRQTCETQAKKLSAMGVTSEQVRSLLWPD